MSKQKSFFFVSMHFKFYSIKCRNEALNSHHRYECRIALALERTQLNKLPLVMASMRAITQKPVQYFIEEAAQGVFDQHDVQNGVDDSRVYRSNDYRLVPDYYLEYFNYVITRPCIQICSSMFPLL